MKFNIKVRFDENGRPVVLNAPERVRNPNDPGTSFKRKKQNLSKIIVKAFRQMNKDSTKRHEERMNLMRESLEVQKMQLEKMREMVGKLTGFHEKMDEYLEFGSLERNENFFLHFINEFTPQEGTTVSLTLIYRLQICRTSGNNYNHTISQIKQTKPNVESSDS